jgi:type I restriction-modification system specificity determinant
MSKENYRRLGDYIREVDVRNRDLEVKELLGVNIGKYFMPSVANVVGTDLSNYKIVYKNQFACNLIHVGRDEKIPIAILDDCESAIVSPAYFTFEISDYDVLLPQYLMMWFCKPEFDREAWFYTDGDVRGGMSKSALLDMSLPVPPIEQQRKIVAEYEAVSRRIRLNEQMIARLEETAQILYHKMFVDGIDKENLPEGWRMGAVCDFGNVITGKTPSSDYPEDFGIDTPFITPGDFQNYNKFAIGSERRLSTMGIERLKNKILTKGSVLVTCIGSDMGKVVVASEQCITNQQINSIIVKKEFYSDYLYYCLLAMRVELKGMALGSSTMPLLNKSDFEKIPMIIPSDAYLYDFGKKVSLINKQLILYSEEIDKLQKLQSLLLTKMNL